MAATQTLEPGPLAPDKMDPKKAAELDKLYAKLERLNKEAEQLGAAMRAKTG
jgi:hypothetical protein